MSGDKESVRREGEEIFGGKNMKVMRLVIFCGGWRTESLLGKIVRSDKIY